MVIDKARSPVEPLATASRAVLGIALAVLALGVVTAVLGYNNAFG